MRFASVLCDSGMTSIEFDRLRIIDFLLCFPKEIENCKWPMQDSTNLRKLTRAIAASYLDQTSIRQAFIPMMKIQNQVVMDMASKDIIHRQKIREGVVAPNEKEVMVTLLKASAEGWEARSEPWYMPILTVLLSSPLNGADGLKARTRLLEYRYDLVGN